jgi:hypothetical protein
MSKKYVKEVVYAKKGDAVVNGSDHGKVYVFGTLIQKKKDIIIPTIEVRKLTHLNTLLIMFSSGNNFSESLHYWQWCC